MSDAQMVRKSFNHGETRLPPFSDFVAGIPYYHTLASGRSTPSLPPVNSLGLAVASSSYDRSRLSSPRPISYGPLPTSPIRQSGQRALSHSPRYQTLDNTLSPIPPTSPKAAASAPATPKSFFCTYCARSFTRHSTYLTHENTHTEQHSYICAYPTVSGGICGRAFTVPGNTYRHLRSKHGVKGGDVRDYVQRQTNHASSHPVDGSSDSDEDVLEQAMGRRASNGSQGSGGRGLRLITE